MNDIKVEITINGNSILITPETDIYEKIIGLKKQDKNIDRNNYNNDPDNCIISKIIYKNIFEFYDENNCRGDTLNTYNSTFGKISNYRLKKYIKKENISIENERLLMEKIEKFKHTYLSIGNFTILERWQKKGETPCINCSRGSFWGPIRDNWPLTLLYIQDFLSDYKKLEKEIERNPLRDSFEKNEATKLYFSRYKNKENGFELFCNDQYFNPKLYDNKDSTYVEEDKNGNYVVKLDLFDGLNISKPLPLNLKEMEQYIDKATLKIIERGKVLLNEYKKNQ